MPGRGCLRDFSDENNAIFPLAGEPGRPPTAHGCAGTQVPRRGSGDSPMSSGPVVPRGGGLTGKANLPTITPGSCRTRVNELFCVAFTFVRATIKRRCVAKPSSGARSKPGLTEPVLPRQFAI